MRGAVIAVVFLAAAWGASAQTPAPPPAPNPVMTHYRAYAAAEARGDYGAARTSAQAALAAAEAAGSPRVGVLATNLARLEALQFNDMERARGPAKRALEAGGEGVDTSEAQILVTLAGSPSRFEALDELVVARAATPGADLGFLFEVSRASGVWALRDERPRGATIGFRRAVALAEQIGPRANMDLVVALTGLGAAHLYLEQFPESAAALNRALDVGKTFYRGNSGPGVSRAERVFWSADAWYAVLRSFMFSEGLRDIPAERARFETSDHSANATICTFEYVKQKEIEYPAKAIDKLAVGTVVVRVALTEDGRVVDPQIITTAPSNELFAPAVMNVIVTWRVEWQASDRPCQKGARPFYLRIPFTIDPE